MASSHFLLLIIICLISLLITPSVLSQSFRPKALVFPITKDTSTKNTQYLTQLLQRTPLVPVTLTIDLGGDYFWVDCDTTGEYVSSSYRPVPCRSAACNLAHVRSCGPLNDCYLFPYSPLARTAVVGNLSTDIVSLHSTNGFNPGRAVSVPKLLFVCSPNPIIAGLPRGVAGMAGLGRKKLGLPALLAAEFSFDRKFAVCLSSSKGVLFFGDGPYVLLPGIDVSKTLTYTPLIKNPVSLVFADEDSAEYYIGVKSVNVDGKPVPVNASVLTIDSKGLGGTRISTIEPYTLLESTIYKAFVEAFIAAMTAKNVARVPAVEPFGACFAAKDIGASRTGPIVPAIELFLGNGVTWRFSGANSMVRVSFDVLCLGFVDGGPFEFVDWSVKFSKTAIVIGGHQIEDNLLQFDLASSRLGFSSSLLSRQTSCSNFNFTTIA